MRKVFQRKYILWALAFLALALPVIDILNWKISEYRLRDAPFQLSHPPEPSFLFIFISLTLFLSLILTKRIILSFLSILLFCVQLFLTIFAVSKLREADWYFSYPENIYFEFLLTGVLLFTSFGISVSVSRFYNQRFPKILLK